MSIESFARNTIVAIFMTAAALASWSVTDFREPTIEARTVAAVQR